MIKYINKLNNRINRISIFLPGILLCISLCFISCWYDDDTDDESADRFVIISYNGPCEGYYMLDNGDIKSFTVNTPMSSGSSYYKYTKNLSGPDYISIHIDFSSEDTYTIEGGSTPATYKTSSVSVYIYASDEIAASDTFSRVYSDTDETVFTITGDLSYDYSSDDDSD